MDYLSKPDVPTLVFSLCQFSEFVCVINLGLRITNTNNSPMFYQFLLWCHKTFWYYFSWVFWGFLFYPMSRSSVERFSLVLWHINHCRLFNAKSFSYEYIKYMTLFRWHFKSNLSSFFQLNGFTYFHLIRIHIQLFVCIQFSVFKYCCIVICWFMEHHNRRTQWQRRTQYKDAGRLL